MIVASTGKAIEESGSPAEDPETIDIEGVSARTELVLGMQLSTTTREDMERSLPAVVAHLNRLLDVDLGQNKDPGVQALMRDGIRLIEHGKRPTTETPTFGVFLYLRDTALIARRLLWVYAEQNGVSTP
ncbi:hypothetical protein ACIQM4_06770 [Streptomyces sp. NPDC091272]|uniref:hypothetical protein n=1 Tax=Streptomyces sp. NPDC091272 TaxID=3365981 RepID=UPI0038288387